MREKERERKLQERNSQNKTSLYWRTGKEEFEKKKGNLVFPFLKRNIFF